MADKTTSKASELLKLAAAKREEANSRRALVRLMSVRELHKQLQQQASELEAEAASLEKEAALLPSAERGTRTLRGVRARGRHT